MPIKPEIELATDPRVRDLVNECYQMRGAMIGCYAHVEFLLADICVDAWQTPGYEALAKPFPYSIESRIREARALFQAAGPLHEFAAEFETLADQALDHEERRHFMAHGLMRVAPTKDSAIIRIELYRTIKGGSAEIGVIEWTKEQMEQATLDIVAYSNSFIRFIYRVHVKMGWVAN